MAENIIPNEYDEVVYLTDPTQPNFESAAPLATPQQVADWYLRASREEVGLAGNMMEGDARALA